MSSELALLGGPKAVKTDASELSRWPMFSQEEIDACSDLLRKGKIAYWGTEDELVEFEAQFAKSYGRKYALLTSSGTAALHSAYYGLGLSRGDEVILPTYTYAAVATPILQLGAIPVLGDSEAQTENISAEAIEEKITPRTKAIVVTHQFGNPSDLDAITRIAKERKIALIEDCAHGLGAVYRGKQIGNFGDAACFSMGTDKVVTGGSAGLLLTDSQEIFERALLLGYKREKPMMEIHSEKNIPYAETGTGFNYNIHPLAFALVKIQFKYLNERIAQRQANYRRLTAGLQGIESISPPVERAYATHAYFGYKPRFNPRKAGVPLDRYLKALQAEGVDIKKSKLRPLHLTGLFQLGYQEMTAPKYTYKIGDLPISEDTYTRLLSMPTFTNDATGLIDEYVAAFHKVESNLNNLAENSKLIQTQNIL